MPNERAERLERSNEELQRLFSAASHDLQEPLRKIVSFGELLERRAGPALDESSRQFLERMIEAARRMSRLVDDIRRYSKLENQLLEVEAVDLERVAGEAVRALKEPIEEAQARVEVGPLPRLEASPTLMRALLQQLLSNAVKFRSQDRPPLVRVTGRERDDGMVELSVADNGIGFEPKFAAEIFEPFHRLNPRAAFEGSGIGLATCRKIVALHGGSLSARSTPGEGATFVIALPKGRAS